MKIILLEKEGTIVPYTPEEHKHLTFKFAYWKPEDVLVIGEQGSQISYDFFMFYKNSTIGGIPERKPDGGGACESGKIKTWYLDGFMHIITSEHMKGDILNALMM